MIRIKNFQIFNKEGLYLPNNLKEKWNSKGRIFTSLNGLRSFLKKNFIVDKPKQGIFENNIPKDWIVIEYSFNKLNSPDDVYQADFKSDEYRAFKLFEQKKYML